jgi:hypothetical protein
MPITYTITKDNTVDKKGEIDPEIFDESFQKDTLPSILSDHPNFIKWVNMMYGNGINKKPEYKFADSFGTWLVFKIGEKGVYRTSELANIFESHYNDEAIDSVVGFNALVDFLQQDWDNDEKQFVETNNVRHSIEKSVKKIKKILREARKMKKQKLPEGEYKTNINKENA